MTQQNRLGFTQIFKDTATDIRQNIQIFVLIVLLWTILSTLLSAPLLEDMAILQKALGADPDLLVDVLGQYGPKILFYSIINIIVVMILPTLWSRLLLLGRNHVTGTILVRHYGAVLLRVFSLIGYQILILVLVLIFSVMLISFGTVIGLKRPVLAVIPQILSLLALVPLYLAFTLSVVGTSIGHKDFGILPALKKMWPFIGLWLSSAILIVLACSAIGSLIMLPFLGEESSPTRLSTLISALTNGIMLLLIFTVAIVHYRHYLMPRTQTAEPQHD